MIIITENTDLAALEAEAIRLDAEADNSMLQSLREGEPCPECNSSDTSNCWNEPDLWLCYECQNAWYEETGLETD